MTRGCLYWGFRVDVKYVGGTVVRYQREQTRLRWAKLREVLTEDDILGNKSVEYIQEKWEQLIKKYDNLMAIRYWIINNLFYSV